MLNWLNNIFGKKPEAKVKVPEKGTKVAVDVTHIFEGLINDRIGRYSDNNKSLNKTKSWYAAEDYYKKKEYKQLFAAFFDYLRDDEEDNVHFTPDGDGFTFYLKQGSRKIYGECDGKMLIARASLAVMEHPNTAVMRRLLELNYTLYYCRSALDDMNTLYMVMDTDVATASPNKLYYGLRELAIKADKQDDLLLADFVTLKAADCCYTDSLNETELDIKYRYFKKWIEETLHRVEELNQDSFSGAIAYLLLGTIYRIDFLMAPQAKLLTELERINNIYWKKKDEVTLVERNRLMKDAIRKLGNISKEEFSASLYNSVSTFSIASPPTSEKIREYISNANKDSHWYIDNKYPDLAILITEYGILYEQFIYSMPRVLTDLVKIYMAVMHPDYFADMGMKQKLYDPATQQFNKELILTGAEQAVKRFQDKYPDMKWNGDRISFNSLYDFATSFSDQVAGLNLKTKRS